MKRLVLGLSVAALAMAGAAFAAEEQWSQAGQQTETRAEAQTKAEKLFDRLDVNHDGKIDHADRIAHLNAMFDRMDTNHDGVISRDEFQAAHQQMMGEHGMERHGMDEQGMDEHRMDEHGMDHHDMAGAGGPGMTGDHRGGWSGHGGMGHMDRGKALVMLILHRADPNHTGVISRDAFVAAALSLFDQADTNHDGKLTPEERRAADKALREAMRARWQAQAGAPIAPAN